MREQKLLDSDLYGPLYINSSQNKELVISQGARVFPSRDIISIPWENVPAFIEAVEQLKTRIFNPVNTNTMDLAKFKSEMGQLQARRLKINQEERTLKEAYLAANGHPEGTPVIIGKGTKKEFTGTIALVRVQDDGDFTYYIRKTKKDGTPAATLTRIFEGLTTITRADEQA